MSRLSSRERRFLFVGVAAILAGFIVRYALVPRTVAWYALRQRLVQERELFARDLGLLSNRTRVQELRRRLEPVRQKATDRTFSGATDELVFASIQKRIQEAATNNGVGVFQVRPEGKPVEVHGLWSYVTASEGETDLETLLRFLADLETASHLLHITRFLVGHSDPFADPATNSGTLRFTLMIAGFAMSREHPGPEAPSAMSRLELPPSTGYLPPGHEAGQRK